MLWVLSVSLELVTSLGEFRHGDSWENIALVDHGLVLDTLVNWNGGVDNMRLDSLTLNDWLDDIMNVVVNMFTDNGLSRLGGLSWQDFAFISELSVLSLEDASNFLVFSVMVFSVFDWDHIVMVLFGVDNLILDWLNVDLMMVLMDFSVDSSCDIFVLLFSDTLVYNGRLGLLLDVDGVVVLVTEDSGHCFLSCLHFDGCFGKSVLKV